jgi:MFS superfamily sulfate permease-like transporter
LGITPLFYWIPKSTLGAIVIFAVAPMFELKILRRAMQISFGDAMAGCITFVVTVLTKVQWGILIGFAACVSLHLSKESGAQTQVLGWLPNKGVGEGYHVWKSTGHRLMEAQEIDHVLVWRVEGPIWFGNARVIKEAFFSLWKTKKPKRRRVSTQDGLIPQIPLAYKAVIFDMSNVNDVDYSGMENLLDMIRHLKKQKLKVLLSGMNQTVGGMFMKKIISLESIEKNPLITAEMMFFNIACAIEYCKDLEEPFEAFSIQEA